MDDDDGETWLHTADVVAGADGTFTNQFQLPDWFVAVYTVTATGGSPGVATTTFTDARIRRLRPVPAGPPHTITVTTTTDEFNTPAPSACSLREAIRAANLDAGADTIVLPAGTYTLTISGDDGDDDNEHRRSRRPPSGDDRRNGARDDGRPAGTSNSNGIDRVFHFTSAGTPHSTNVTVQFGRASNDGGGRLKVDSGSADTDDVTVTEQQRRERQARRWHPQRGNVDARIARRSAQPAATRRRRESSRRPATCTLDQRHDHDNTSPSGAGLRITSDDPSLTNVTVSHNTAAPASASCAPAGL